MPRIVAPVGRAYRSQLRADQAEETRARILDATIRVMAGGAASVSIPAVAREAGVSVPTIYRHFGTKHALLHAIYPHLQRRAGLDDLISPRTVDEFHQMVRAMWGRLESLGDEARAAMTSLASEEVRLAHMPDRLAMSHRFAASVAPDASPDDQDRIARLMLVLTTSAAMRVWLDYIGSSVDEASDDVDWALRAAIASATPRKDP